MRWGIWTICTNRQVLARMGSWGVVWGDGIESLYKLVGHSKDGELWCTDACVASIFQWYILCKRDNHHNLYWASSTSDKGFGVLGIWDFPVKATLQR